MKSQVVFFSRWSVSWALPESESQAEFLCTIHLCAVFQFWLNENLYKQLLCSLQLNLNWNPDYCLSSVKTFNWNICWISRTTLVLQNYWNKLQTWNVFLGAWMNVIMAPTFCPFSCSFAYYAAFRFAQSITSILIGPFTNSLLSKYGLIKPRS